MAATTTFNILLSSEEIKKLYKNHVWHSGNIPIQFNTAESFGKFVKECKGSHPILLSKRVEEYVPLSLGDEVCIYDRWVRVKSKTFDIDAENLSYDVG